MNKFIKASAFALIAFGFTSCGSDDPCTSDKPVVEVAPNTISGVVTSVDGAPVKGATVTVGNLTATTDASGIYTISGVPTGTVEATITAPGMYPTTGTFNVASGNSQNLVWSPVLNKEESKQFNVTVTGGGEGEAQSENLPQNAEGKVEITVAVADNTVPANTTIRISPIYTEESASVMGRAARANDETLLIGANVSCSDPNLVLSQDIDVAFSLDASVAQTVVTKQYVNGQWETVPHTNNNGEVVIKTRKFTSFGIFMPVTVTTASGTESISFQRSVWENNGSSNIHIGDATYNYKAGTQINYTADNKLKGLLIEYLARIYGSKVTNMTGKYPLNFDLTPDWVLTLKGWQTTSKVTVASGNTSVSGTTYGTVTIESTLKSVGDHNGGVGY